MRIVIAVDGSPVSNRAARHVIKLATALREPPRITLLTASPPMQPGVERKLGAAALRAHHQRDFDMALRGARAALRRAGLEFKEHGAIGFAAEAIVGYCTRARCDLLVMGSRGRNAMQSAFLGSEAMKVLSNSKVPVTIVR